MNILRNFLAALALMAILFGGLCPSASGQSPIKLRTVVIDPGHGGKDAGCTSRDGKVLEKTVVLDIGTRLKKKIEAGCPDVKVVITRDKDYFVTLQGRADIANRNSADLFISIHVNSVEGKKTGPNGYSIHTLGQYTSRNRDLYAGNMEVVRRENSVILLEDDYSTRYEGFDPNDPESYIFMNLMQNAYLEQSLKFAQYVDKDMKNGAIRNSRGISQDPFYVLWKTAMPAVLIECGFMSNPTDRSSLNTAKGRDRIASDIYRAFVEYKKEYDGENKDSAAKSVSPQSDPSESLTDASTVKEAADSEESVLWGTQVLASSKAKKTTDSFFQGYECRRFTVGRLYKYVIGISSDREEAQENYRKIRKKFEGAFFVRVENGEIYPEK